jgi:hypothetical protein
MLAGHPVGSYHATAWLTDRCTLSSPDRTAADGWRVAGTNVPCRVIESSGGPVIVPGALPTVQTPRVYLARAQAIAVGWRLVLPAQGNRTLTVERVGTNPEHPLQQVETAGIRR